MPLDLRHRYLFTGSYGSSNLQKPNKNNFNTILLLLLVES